MAAKFQNILVNLLCRYPCYTSSPTFVDFFDRLKAVAGKGDEESFQIQSVRKIAMKTSTNGKLMSQRSPCPLKRFVVIYRIRMSS